MISNFILPFIVLIVIGYGIIKRVNVYNTFVEGAKESFDMSLRLFPTLLAMILGVNIFVKSGVLDFFFVFLSPIFSFVKIPKEVIFLSVMRPISGSSGIALLNNILEVYGGNHFISKMASVIQGSTDTTFYILTLYFGSIGIKKTRYALKVGLLADLVGIISAIFIAKIFF